MLIVKSSFKESALYKIWDLLPKIDRKKTLFVVLIQMSLGFLDLLGVAIVGALGALAVSGVQSNKPTGKVTELLTLVNLENSTFQQQMLILGLVASLLLVSRTLISVFFTKRSLHFLSNRGAKISGDLVAKFLNLPIHKVRTFGTYETSYALTTGVWTLVLEILGTAILIISDLSLLIVMSAGLLIVDPLVATFSILIFGFLGYLAYRYMQRKARTLGELKAKLEIESTNTIAEAILSYKESQVRGRRSFYAEKISKLRVQLAGREAEYNFMPYISKYLLETTVVLGTLALCFVQFTRTDAVHAVGVLAVFMAAGSRIAPAVLRIQQGAILIRARSGQTKITFDVIDLVEGTEPTPKVLAQTSEYYLNFKPQITIKNVSYKYPNSLKENLSNINLTIRHGEVVAVVGPSGAGKTSLIDLILGVITPSVGTVEFDDLTPSIVISNYPGAIAYVPQDIVITNSTIRENITIGYPREFFSENQIWEALNLAHLSEFVKNLPGGLDAAVGEFGSMLSGGQKQRLGIARALITNPQILVLDEATSALDAESEKDITDSILDLKGKTTVILIAHRLSSVRIADKVVYLNHGNKIAEGTFDSVRSEVPDFARQAELMGL
jgi:ABC-type multidrug transport system fused ATPase/permease subunit